MSTATFLKSDSTTNGAWYNGTTTVYGADGYGLPDPDDVLGSNNPKWPSYASVSFSPAPSEYSYSGATSAVQALEYPPPGTSDGSDSKRIATVWYGNPGSVQVEISDGAVHQVALYFWDDSSYDRDLQIQITDNNDGGAVLDTRTTGNTATAPVWMVWAVSGNVTFSVTVSSGGNDDAILSGIFFDPVSQPAIFPPFVSRPRFEPAHYE